jgi:DHA2 family methylenomycin A resistance protein-like MFS transporter
MRNASLKFQPFPADGINAGSEGKSAPTNLSTSLTPAAMSLGYGVVQLDVTIVNTALNSIGIAAGVLNATRQTGSVLGVALFGSLIGQADAFMAGAHAALIISASLLLAAAAAIWLGISNRASH